MSHNSVHPSAQKLGGPMTESPDIQINSTIKEEMDYVQRLALDLRDVLRQQREALKDSGFRLPPGTTTTLNEIARRIEMVNSRLGNLEHERDQYRALADVASL